MAKEEQEELYHTLNQVSENLTVYQYGHHKASKQHVYDSEKRKNYVFCFVVDGRGIYGCGGREFTITKGIGFLVKPDEEVWCRADKNEPWEYFFIEFHGASAQRFIVEIPWEDGCIFRATQPDAIERRMKSLCKRTQDEGGNKYRVLGETYLLLSEMVQKEQSGDDDAEKQGKHDVILAQVIGYIEENWMRSGFLVSEIAKHMNMDRTGLYRIFKDKTGVSIVQYLKNYRMSRAAALLLTTEMSVKEVAINVGIPDYTYFSKCFKNHHGYSPKEYRDNSHHMK